MKVEIDEVRRESSHAASKISLLKKEIESSQVNLMRVTEENKDKEGKVTRLQAEVRRLEHEWEVAEELEREEAQRNMLKVKEFHVSAITLTLTLCSR